MNLNLQVIKTNRMEWSGTEWSGMEWNGAEQLFHSIVWIFYDGAEQTSHTIVWKVGGTE